MRQHPVHSARIPRLVLIGLAVGLVAYGYGPDQDPLVTGFKRVAAHARSDRWHQADRALDSLRPFIDEIRDQLGITLERPLRDAIERHSVRDLARGLTALAYGAIELKFESSIREDLEDYYAAKYRIEAARGYYMELLAPAVRRRDGRGGSELHTAIWGGFDAARASLGSPGFLGRGAEAPDGQDFEMARAQVSNALRQVFPYVSEEPR